MAFVPNNVVGNEVVSKGAVFYEQAVLMAGTAIPAFPTSVQTPFINVGGLPNISFVCGGTDEGTAPEYPDSTVGSVWCFVDIASGNSGKFDPTVKLSKERVATFLIPLTSTSTFQINNIIYPLNVSTKFIQLNFIFLVGQEVNNYAKFYARIHASG